MPKLYQFLLTSALLFSGSSVLAQCTEWDRLLSYESVNLQDAARDLYGNTYLAGGFYDKEFNLGPYSFSPPSGGFGAFIAKFDKNDSLIWATSPETDRYALAMEIEIDAFQNIVVAGFYGTSISFDCQTLRGGERNAFVVSYTKDGNPLWATSSSNAGGATLSGLTISPNGNIIIISDFVEKSFITPGLTEPDIVMGGVPVTTGAVDQLNAGLDSFIAAIRPDGTVAWTQGVGGDGNAYDYLVDVITDSENNIIVTGYFNSPQVSFDGHLVHSYNGTENCYVAKLNSEGETLWVRDIEGGAFRSGWGIDTDANDNIFVVGRFYGDAKFGGLELAQQGEVDIFVVKLDPAGTALKARVIGNADIPAHVVVDPKGRVLVSGNYLDDYFELGSFSSSKGDATQFDSFVATMSNDLTDVECAKFITGDGDAIVTGIETDPFENMLVRVERFSPEGTLSFDSQIIPASNSGTVLAILGHHSPANEAEPPSGFSQFLGNDTTLCIGQKLNLTARQMCNAQYNWSTGSSGTAIEVTQAGVYWVDVTRHGNTVRDQINVSYFEPISFSLDDEYAICPGSVVSWTLPVYNNTTYLWSDGGDSPTNTVTVISASIYWVEVSNRCETIRETVTLQLKSSPDVDLGHDIVACDGDDVTLRYTPAAGETLLWSDGSTLPTLSVTESGTYQLAVNNGCIETTASVQITIKNSGSSPIPNVVTYNGDGKNDYFLLPPDVQNASLLIFNRWGDEVFYARSYENNWPQTDLTPGVYFYTLDSDCIPDSKGIIHLIR